MTLLMLLLMAYMHLSYAAHKWMGISIFVLFIIHHLLNDYWHKNLFKGRYNWARLLGTGVDSLLLILMLALIWSSAVLSRAFPFMCFRSSHCFAREIHSIAAYWLFILMGVHIGLHWHMFLQMIKNAYKMLQNFIVLSRTFVFLLATYGFYVFIKRDFFRYLFGNRRFVSGVTADSLAYFLLDYTVVLCLFAIAGYYIYVMLRGKNQKPGEFQ